MVFGIGKRKKAVPPPPPPPSTALEVLLNHEALAPLLVKARRLVDDGCGRVVDVQGLSDVCVKWHQLNPRHQDVTIFAAAAMVLLAVLALLMRLVKQPEAPVTGAVEKRPSITQKVSPTTSPSRKPRDSPIKSPSKRDPQDPALLKKLVGVVKEREQRVTSANSSQHDEELKDAGPDRAPSPTPAEPATSPAREAPATPASVATPVAAAADDAKSPAAAAAAAVTTPRAPLERRPSLLDRLTGRKPSVELTPPPAGAAAAAAAAALAAAAEETPLPQSPLPPPPAVLAPAVAEAREAVAAAVPEEVELNGPPSPTDVADIGLIEEQAAAAEQPSLFQRIASAMSLTGASEESAAAAANDAVVTRDSLGDEFDVVFVEGSMGMTLEMDPKKNAQVTELKQDSQASRGGVLVGDRVIAVEGKAATSYGTVLGFLNMAGKPVEISFRKSELYDADGNSAADIAAQASSAAVAAGGRPPSLHAALDDNDAMTGTAETSAPLNSTRSGSVNKLVAATRSNSFARMFGRGGSVSDAPGSPFASGAGGAPAGPLSPAASVGSIAGFGLSRRDSSRSRAAVELAASNDSFAVQMAKGVVVTKYSRSGKGGQRALYYDEEAKSVAWRDPLSSLVGNKRSNSLSRLVKGEREALPLASLQSVVGGDEPDAEADGAAGASAASATAPCGTAQLRMCCGGNPLLLASSFSLLFGERSLEVTAASPAHMKVLVAGFRELLDQEAGAVADN